MTPVEQDPARELVARAIVENAVRFDIDCAGSGETDEAIEEHTTAVMKVLAAARSEGYAQARAEDIAALRDRDRWLEWWKTHPLTSFDEHLNDRAATYLASLTPTQEAP